MAIWEVTPTTRKSVEEHELWYKDDMAIRRITAFRTASFTIETEDDTKPELELSDSPSGPAIDMFNCGYDAQLETADGGWWADVIYPDDMPEEERDRLEQLWQDDPYSAWEEEGWYSNDTQYWFTDGVVIEKIQDIILCY